LLYLLSAGPVASVLVNRIGCRVVSIAGSLIAGVFFALSLLSPNIDVMILTYGVMGGRDCIFVIVVAGSGNCYYVSVNEIVSIYAHFRK